jgi:arginine deiminase
MDDARTPKLDQTCEWTPSQWASSAHCSDDAQVITSSHAAARADEDNASALIESEVGRLEWVLVHEPGKELERLTPDNRRDFLFDELLWPRRASQEHRAFVSALAASGARVFHLERELTIAAQAPAAHAQLVADAVEQATVAPRAKSWIQEWLEELPHADLVRVLIAGFGVADLPESRDGRSWWPTEARNQFVLAPLPNQMFMRDSSFWFGDRWWLGGMRDPTRHRETSLVRILYRHHPLLQRGCAAGGGAQQPPGVTLEGGDVVVLSPEAVVLGVGARTSPAAVLTLADELSRRNGDVAIVAVVLPNHRATMHLDTLMTLVDRDMVLAAPRLFGCPAYMVCTDGKSVHVDRFEDVRSAVKAGLGLCDVQFVGPPVDAPLAREQWDDGCNVLATGPRQVIAYESNEALNARLEREGVHVMRVPGSELRRARGGPRCLSCPVRRARL